MADPYQVLGVGRDATADAIRKAYRRLAKQHHPDVNPRSPRAMDQIQNLNAAYAELGDSQRRQAYDLTLAQNGAVNARKPDRPATLNINQDMLLAYQDFLNGTTIHVIVQDPARPAGVETYPLVVPPGTAPGTRFRWKRTAPFERGLVVLRLKARPDFRFKSRGSDLRCELKISAQRATAGGLETVRGVTGQSVRVPIPPHVPRGHIVRITGAGLPKPRGGRGDLLVRITYRPVVQAGRVR